MKVIKPTIVLLLLIFLLINVSSCSLFKKERSQILVQLLKSGNEAFSANKFKKAIESYDAALALSPKEPIFLTNKSVALLRLSTERYNQAIKLSDVKIKNQEMEESKKGFLTAAELSIESTNIIKSSTIFDLFDYTSRENFRLNTFSIRADTLRIVAEFVDNKRVDEAVGATNEYIDLENDEDKKIKTRLNTGKMLINTQNWEKAIVEYKKILDSDNENIEALLGMGMALAQPNEEDKFAEAKIYLQKFVDKAPDSHSSLEIAKGILNTKWQK